MTHHLSPVEPPYQAEIANLLDTYPKQDGYLLTLFRVFANSPRFLKKGVPNLLDKASPLSLTEREIVVLRVTAIRGCEYEWGVHVTAFSEVAGLDARQIRSTCFGTPEDTCWSPHQTILIQAVDELLTSGRLTPETQRVFEAAFSKDQQLEIMSLCGAYQTISFVANVSGIAPEDFAARFPE